MEINKRDLDNYITGHYGEDQFKDEEEEAPEYCEKCGGSGQLKVLPPDAPPTDYAFEYEPCGVCDGTGVIFQEEK